MLQQACNFFITFSLYLFNIHMHKYNKPLILKNLHFLKKYFIALFDLARLYVLLYMFP